MYDQRLRKLAHVLVHYSTGVKKGDVVRIRMAPVAEPLALAVYEEVVKTGGHPFVRMVPEACKELMCRHGKPFQLDYLSPFDLIVPCGIPNVEMTSVARESGRSHDGLGMDVRLAVVRSFAGVFGYEERTRVVP